ncbi:aminodeoxychorismate synthase component I [Pseudarthrobacter sp. J1763]|uniref:aminodeoxychorismate synthase component I n=1 Tax=Pseudarthrobacter sp. J1763 TaxID=3420445 RepID=UPI003D265A13
MSPAPVIIGIDGRSGAGKTTLAVELAAALREHRKVSLFHLEDIYPGWNGLSAGIERYVNTVLAPLKRGEDAEWVCWDWEQRYDGDTRLTAAADVVIVEGVGACSEAARAFLDVVVWVESADDERKRRALDRDGEVFAGHWDEWAQQEEEWLAEDPVHNHAQVTVKNAASGSAPADVLHLLSHLPALEHVLAPERLAQHSHKLFAERLDVAADPARVFDALYADSPRAIWLDSSIAETHTGAPQADTPQRSRWSIMADDAGPHGAHVTHRPGITTVRAGSASATIESGFFRWLDGEWGTVPASDWASSAQGYSGDFTLGWLGYLGYELKHETGGRPAALAEDSAPDAELIFAGRAVVFDHLEDCVWLLSLFPLAGDSPAHQDNDWARQARAAVNSSARHSAHKPRNPETLSAPVFSARDSEREYKAKIAQAQHQIAEGNTYEVCLTTTVTARVPALKLWETYLRLRAQNPAPFAAYLRFGACEVASTSPERFIKIGSDGGLRAEPIKGTRRRSSDPAVDQKLREELASSGKDRAENIMIVDLLRNDLSHYAVPGSVKVPRLCAIESYATVHQMVSTIDAQLLPGASRSEAVAAAFPAGSMTGAPKISTMAILDELEVEPRGVYSGALGYFSLNGATDLSVVIRTLVARPDGDGGTELSIGIGGAITADSAPQEEYEEIRIKASGILGTLGSSFPSR